MVIAERLCYRLGEVLADIILISVGPTSLFTTMKVTQKTIKVTQKFSKFAILHSIDSTSVDAVSENLFECLPFLE